LLIADMMAERLCFWFREFGVSYQSLPH
jgi:hypothetical protein